MTHYHAYLIRFWREDEHLSWRASLVLPQTGERRHFASAEQAFTFLTERLAEKDRENTVMNDDGS